jgi:hypothetical protein
MNDTRQMRLVSGAMSTLAWTCSIGGRHMLTQRAGTRACR